MRQEGSAFSWVSVFLVFFVILSRVCIFEAMLTCSCTAESSSTASWKVPDDFRTIQDAINNAKEGDVILVGEGVFHERIVLNKSVSLLGRGQESTVIDAGGLGSVVTISANKCLISGFTIRNGNLYGGYGVYVNNADNNAISSNTITGTFVGIKLGDKLRGSFSNVVRHNNVTGNHFGLFMAHAERNIAYGNTISGSAWNGIELDWSNWNVMYNNTVLYSRAYGLETPINTPSRYNTFYNNNFINNSFGVSVSEYTNTWDNGHQIGGNYWSDYNGSDLYYGVDQNRTGSDGIGDHPYELDSANQDRYPLMNLYNLPDTVAAFNFTPRIIVVNETVIFDASPSNSVAGIMAYDWLFGDGLNATGVIVTHAYGLQGTYTVILNVMNRRGVSNDAAVVLTVQSGERQWFAAVAYYAIGVAGLCFFVVLVGFLRHKKTRGRESLACSF
jgi:parallel beta-helix repeat protein